MRVEGGISRTSYVKKVCIRFRLLHLIKDNALFSMLELKLFRAALVGHKNVLGVEVRRVFQKLTY